MLPAKNSQNWLPSLFNDFFETDWIPRTHVTSPAINVMEADDKYTVEAAVPGMTKEDINIHLTDDNLLVITMEKKNQEEEKDKKYLRREFSYSKYEQSLILPEDVEKEQISAKVADGVLTVELPKMTEQEKEKSCRQIEIQ